MLWSKIILGGGGILIEADNAVFQALLKNRPNPKTAKYNVAIYNKDKQIKFMQISGYAQMLSGIISEYDPHHLKRIENEITQYGGSYEIFEMQGIRFDTLMHKHPDITRIDYLSVDVEGGEKSILESIDFNAYHIQLIGVENNYKDSWIKNFLSKQGYRKIIELGCDEFYEKIPN
ncbi:FkbM family methyltransferase [Helicobacter himalayensis]|uniref:FkbM family methyltransferase n=1 Tax=Helicobacter himalayensis TaxID=1591088 RepID=UPI00082CF691|nr:FkbM family methyltransferase [Helicobacter himalayensis]